MAYFDVRYYGSPVANLHFAFVRTLSNNPDEAIEIFAYRSKTVRHHIDKAIRLRNEWDTCDKEYWRDKWSTAFVRMPTKIKNDIYIDWVIVPKGTTAIPEYIKGRAKGELQEINGNLCRKKVTKEPRRYGQVAALAIILGYITWTGKDHRLARANCCVLQGRKMIESSRPRTARQRKLLSLLPSMSDDQIAQLLEQGRRKMRNYRGKGTYQ